MAQRLSRASTMESRKLAKGNSVANEQTTSLPRRSFNNCFQDMTGKLEEFENQLGNRYKSCLSNNELVIRLKHLHSMVQCKANIHDIQREVQLLRKGLDLNPVEMSEELKALLKVVFEKLRVLQEMDKPYSTVDKKRKDKLQKLVLNRLSSAYYTLKNEMRSMDVLTKIRQIRQNTEKHNKSITPDTLPDFNALIKEVRIFLTLTEGISMYNINQTVPHSAKVRRKIDKLLLGTSHLISIEEAYPDAKSLYSMISQCILQKEPQGNIDTFIAGGDILALTFPPPPPTRASGSNYTSASSRTTVF